MAFDFKSEEEAKEYLDKLGIEYRFSCFKEKNTEGCHLLGDYLDTVKKEFDTAAKLYQKNCDESNYAKSCMKYGSFSYLGRGTEEDKSTSLKYFTKACTLNLPEGCLNAGVMLTKEKDMEKDYVKGLELLEKSCSLGNATACYFASGLYITGADGVPQNRTKASELSQLACNGGNLFACMNLSHMYRVGDGVVKDEKKAEQFKARAREIRDDMKKKRSVDLQQYT